MFEKVLKKSVFSQRIASQGTHIEPIKYGDTTIMLSTLKKCTGINPNES